MNAQQHEGAAAWQRTQVFEGGRVRLQPRVRLLENLLEETGSPARLHRLTVVCAPTGYSKTRTVAAWLGDSGNTESGGSEPITDPSSESVVWVQCNPDNPLWPQLANALTPGHHVRVTGIANASDSVHAAIQATKQLAQQLTAPLTIVIDDYHHCTSADNDLALADLSSISQHLDLVVVTRRSTLLDSTFVTARTRVRAINREDLAYTPNESYELAASLGIAINPRLQQALDQAAGWPLAIRAALNLGSDSLYLSASSPQRRDDTNSSPTFDPVANLASFAYDYLKLLRPTSRKMLVAASLLDAVSLTQLQEFMRIDRDRAEESAQELSELGLFEQVGQADEIEYRCHSSVRPSLEELAKRTLPAAKRAELYQHRAVAIEHTAPLTAFRLFFAARDYTSAETLLACNFTVLTDETDILSDTLRSVPEEVLSEHPTFIAAQLFLKLPQPLVAPATLQYLTGLWVRGLQQRLPQGSATIPGPIHLPLLVQTMVASRVTGQLDVAASVLHRLEARLIPSYLSDESIPATEISLHSITKYAGSLPIYFREAAATALVIGDHEMARRNLLRLQRHSERRISKPWRGFPHGSTRTVTDAESGHRWLLAALSELAYTETLDGNMRRCADLLNQFETHAADSKTSAPGISWTGAEIARAHLSYEVHDPSMLEAANERLAPFMNRLEAWQLLVLADAGSIRLARGAEAGLAHLQAAVARAHELGVPQHEWRNFLTGFETMLCTLVGNFQRTEQLLNSSPAASIAFQLERARLALFTQEYVEALLIAQNISDVGATKRQQLDRDLTIAIASWQSGQHEQAFVSFKQAAQIAEQFNLYSKLTNVPYAELHSLAVTAKDAGLPDLTPALESVPQLARPRSYRRLTEMELRTVRAVAQHRSTNDAAAALFVTPGTVKKHLASIYRKFDARSRDEALLVAGRMGLLEKH